MAKCMARRGRTMAGPRRGRGPGTRLFESKRSHRCFLDAQAVLRHAQRRSRYSSSYLSYVDIIFYSYLPSYKYLPKFITDYVVFFYFYSFIVDYVFLILSHTYARLFSPDFADFVVFFSQFIFIIDYVDFSYTYIFVLQYLRGRSPQRLWL